jgi:hypothetical protein
MMPSKSHRRWFTTQAAALDQMENAHASVGGEGRGRRFATDQINHMRYFWHLNSKASVGTFIPKALPIWQIFLSRRA